MSKEDGFTLIELMVVVLIIAILAAIAIPVYVRYLEHAEAADSRAVLKDAAISIESYAARASGDYSGLDGADSGPPGNPAFNRMFDEGLRKSAAVSVSVAATPNRYCITIINSDLPGAHAWFRATYNSADGYPSPSDVDTCP